MAFYKINGGKEENLPSALTEGSSYFCIDTGNLFIDHKNTSGTLVRTKVSSKYAEKLRYTKDGNFVEIDPTTILTDSNYETKIGTATQSKNGLISTEDKIKLDGIEAEANKYILPAATSSALGGIIAETATDDDTQAVRIGVDNKLVTAKNVFCVNLTESEDDSGNFTFTADKTHAEILAAYNAGKYVYILVPASGSDSNDSIAFPLTAYIESENVLFFNGFIPDNNQYYIFYCFNDGTNDIWDFAGRAFTTSSDLSSLVKNITISGKTITITKYNGSTSTIATQDANVNVTLGTTTKAYLLGTSTTPTSSAKAVTAISDTGVYLDTTAGQLVATTFKGTLSGNASSATKATQDSAGNQINSTYIKSLSISGKVITITKGNNTTSTITTQDTTYSAFTGATESAAGTTGLVPVPAIGDHTKYLKGDGTWGEITDYSNFLVLDENGKLAGIKMVDQENGFDYVVSLRSGNIVTSCAVSELVLTSNPTKMSYTAGDYIDTEGMVITATYADGTSREITGYTCDNYVSVENPNFTISYTEGGSTYTVDIPVTVTAFDPAVVLIDFTYTDNGDGTYTILDWKETYNGEPSTEMIVPDNAYIIL